MIDGISVKLYVTWGLQQASRYVSQRACRAEQAVPDQSLTTGAQAVHVVMQGSAGGVAEITEECRGPTAGLEGLMSEVVERDSNSSTGPLLSASFRSACSHSPATVSLSP